MGILKFDSENEKGGQNNNYDQDGHDILVSQLCFVVVDEALFSMENMLHCSFLDDVLAIFVEEIGEFEKV